MINIIDKSKCCGCNACINVCPKSCISKIHDEEGFTYPQVESDACIDCHLCEKVCPVLNPGAPVTPITTEAIILKDEQKRLASSSGGVFTAISETIIALGGVVFGAKWTDDFRLVHDYTETIEGIAAFRGSKYVQCDTCDSYTKVRDFLNDDRWVLFSGTPCQIRGLKLFLRKDYNKLITVDFICHGVPSLKVLHAYLKEEIKIIKEQTKEQDLRLLNIDFRNKETGWHNYQLALEFDNDKRKRKFLISTSSFMKGYGGNFYQRPSCHSCIARNFSSGSDFTLADYWGVEDQHPDMDDDKGTSLVAIKTKHAKCIIDSITSLKRKRVNKECAYRLQVSLYKSLAVPFTRQEFWANDWQNNFSEIVEKLSGHLNDKGTIENMIRILLRRIGVKKIYKLIQKHIWQIKK